MKKLMVFLIATLWQLNISACENVSNVCLTNSNFPKDAVEFLNLDREIGSQSYDLNFLDQLLIFSAENIDMEFGYEHTTNEALTQLGFWATQKLGKYSAPENDAFEMLRTAKKMNKNELGEFLDDLYLDIDERLAEIASGESEDFSTEMKLKVKRYLKIRNKAKNLLLNAIFPANKQSKVVVYELLDNNNENVADAQYVIVSDEKLVLVNRFWWL
jgi:hypothetical protein